MANTIPPTPAGKSRLVDLARQCREDSERWFGDSDVSHSMIHHALALCGEAGEFGNLVKKVERGSLHLRDAKVRHAMTMELADVLTYLLNLAAMLNVDLEAAYHVKRTENNRRFTEERLQREAPTDA